MTALKLVARYLLEKLPEQRPLFVALQGPQGSGKSYLSAHLQEYLQEPPHSLRVAILSIDDLYLPHEELTSLALSNPQNPLWKGRGQPGTHDVGLGVQILSALKAGNGTVELPRFDKSLFTGEGDRLPMDGTGLIVVQPPRLDIVILEGWCVGFSPISNEDLLSRWNGVWKIEREKLGLGLDEMGRLVDVQAINDKLKSYQQLWAFFDIFVQLKPETPSSSELSRYNVVYKWRLEQEHYMKAHNGGKGMSDAAVKSLVNFFVTRTFSVLIANRFVDRYIPGYVFFGDSSVDQPHESTNRTNWSGSCLTLVLDEKRTVIGTSHS